MKKPPDGYCYPEIKNTWQISFYFAWSPVFENWIKFLGVYDIRPGESWTDAFHRQIGNSPKDNEFFFVVD